MTGMKLNDGDAGLRCFERMLALAESLQDLRIAVYAHTWDGLDFGRWSLIAGTRHRGFLFSWDGREGIMTVRGPFHTGHGTPAQAAVVANESLGVGPALDPLNFVLRFFESRQHEI